MGNKNNDIGIIGLSVMGLNLALNMADHNYKVSVFNRTVSVVSELEKNNAHKNFTYTYNIEDFVQSLARPRKIMLMIKAGKAVDMVIDSLIPLLEEKDIIIDGGNSYFKDTIIREKLLNEKGINYIGTGVSGGEEGARFGPAIMSGGKKEAYDYVKNIFSDISAKVDNHPCSAYISENGAGHYVKMVHNGIEYADMQLISEAYLILKHIGNFTNDELSLIFEKWNESELESYLIEITSKIFKVKEDNNYLIDEILDVARQKGTGKWTNLEAIDLGVDISTISAALNMRFMSTLKNERIKASEIFPKQAFNINIPKEELVDLVKYSLYVSKIIAYAQGFKLLSESQEVYNWKLDFSEIAKIFRGGCIIRAKFLNDISDAFLNYDNKENLIFTKFFFDKIVSYEQKLRKIVEICTIASIPIPAMSSALSYLDVYSCEKTGANLIQAQRDYFGAHTFEKIGQEGSFHFDWSNYEK